MIDGSSPFDAGGNIIATGEIERITPFELPHPDLLVERDGVLSIDPVIDDQSLVICMNSEAMLLCGCCHAGIVNTITSVKRKFWKYPGGLINLSAVSR